MSGIPTPVHAQWALPAITVGSTGTRSVTAGEASFHVWYKRIRLESVISFRDQHYPIDSMLRVVSENATMWLGRLRQQPVTGLQLEPSGDVGARAKQDTYAKAQFTKALTMSGRPISDQAFALLSAVEAYADWRQPEELPQAEVYMNELAALGAAAAPRQYKARELLMRQYYLLGRSADLIRHGMAAIALIPQMEYADQGSCFPMTSDVFTMLVDALAGQSNGRQQIEALGAVLQAAVEPPAALLATDSGAYDTERTRRKWLIKLELARVAKLGTMGQPWTANYWVNRATHDSASIAVTDGKIRLVEVFGYTCDGCVVQLHILQRLKQRYPSIEAMGLTYTEGSWYNRLVEPDDEATRLDHFFVNQLKLTIPVGIWKAPKILGEDGGMVPDISTWPNKDYKKASKSCVWLIDGQGRIRAIYDTFITRDDELELGRKIEFLEREAAIQQRSTSTIRPVA